MEEKNTASNEEQRDPLVTERPRPKYMSVNIKLADAHYLVSFDHGPHRVFHNMEELLRAIEVKVKELGGTLGGR